MKKVIIIDHENERKKNIEKKINECSISVKSYSYVWGDNFKANPDYSNDDFEKLEKGDVYFIHSSNTGSDDIIDFLIDKNENTWIVEYSGGGKSFMGNRMPKSNYHLLYEEAVNISNNFPIEKFKDFFEAIKNKYSKPFDKLTGFDPVLETKLVLLHQCLTPDGARNFVIDNSTMDKFIKDEYNNFIKYINDKEIKTYNQDYIDALTILRDNILIDY